MSASPRRRRVNLARLLLAFALGLALGCRGDQDTEEPGPPETRAACCRAICACFGTEPPPEVYAAHRQTVANCEKRKLNRKRCGCTEPMACP